MKDISHTLTCCPDPPRERNNLRKGEINSCAHRTAIHTSSVSAITLFHAISRVIKEEKEEEAGFSSQNMRLFSASQGKNSCLSTLRHFPYFLLFPFLGISLSHVTEQQNVNCCTYNVHKKEENCDFSDISSLGIWVTHFSFAFVTSEHNRKRRRRWFV